MDTAHEEDPQDASAAARASYWESYYATHASAGPRLPSQFAAFVAGELHRPHRVIELGCGNGRDALFFARFGHDVVGVDASNSAIEGCRRAAEAVGEQVTFTESTIDAPGLAERVRGGHGPRLVYARFFLHAITEDEERSLLALAAAIADPGDLFAVEYRTVRDSSGARVTGAHYRRYVLPASFEARALGCGFEVIYAVEGFGFAKYREDDAYVARTLLRRRAT